MSFGAAPSPISISHGNWVGLTFSLISTPSTANANSKFYDLTGSSGAGLEFRPNGSSFEMYLLTDDNTDPTKFTVGSSTTLVSNSIVSVGDTIKFYRSTTATFLAQIVVPDVQYSSGGGTGTEEVFVPDAKIVNYGGLSGLRFEPHTPTGFFLIL